MTDTLEIAQQEGRATVPSSLLDDGDRLSVVLHRVLVGLVCLMAVVAADALFRLS